MFDACFKKRVYSDTSICMLPLAEFGPAREGAYDGIGFGMRRSRWKKPMCGGISSKKLCDNGKFLAKGLIGVP